MPLPFLLVGAAAAAGIGTHINAKKKNEEAQNLINSAERLYNNTKKILDIANNENIEINKETISRLQTLASTQIVEEEINEKVQKLDQNKKEILCKIINALGY